MLHLLSSRTLSEATWRTGASLPSLLQYDSSTEIPDKMIHSKPHLMKLIILTSLILCSSNKKMMIVESSIGILKLPFCYSLSLGGLTRQTNRPQEEPCKLYAKPSTHNIVPQDHELKEENYYHLKDTQRRQVDNGFSRPLRRSRSIMSNLYRTARFGKSNSTSTKRRTFDQEDPVDRIYNSSTYSSFLDFPPPLDIESSLAPAPCASSSEISVEWFRSISAAQYFASAVMWLESGGPLYSLLKRLSQFLLRSGIFDQFPNQGICFLVTFLVVARFLFAVASNRQKNSWCRCSCSWTTSSSTYPKVFQLKFKSAAQAQWKRN